MKPWLRQAFGPAYPILIKAKTSPASRFALAMLGAPSYFFARMADQGRIGIDITERMGMGAIIARALLVQVWIDQSAIDGYTASTSPLYADDNRDIFGDFFCRDAWPANVAPLRWRGEDFVVRRLAPAHLNFDHAATLFAAHFKPNPMLRDRIEQAAQGIGRFDASVHYRGTDKSLESGHVAFDAILTRLEGELAGVEQPKVFLATDDAEFASAARISFARVAFTSFDIGDVAAGQPRHFSDLAPRDKALEALVNIFLLARAPVCLRTSSYLSAISLLANPAMRSVTVNKTLAADTCFPESEVLAREAGW